MELKGSLRFTKLIWLPVFLLILGCKTPGIDRISRSQPLLGTIVVVTAEAEPSVAHVAINSAFDEIRRVDSLLSLHKAGSELVRLNSSASQGPVKVSSELFSIVKLAQKISNETKGSFDVTIRPLAELY